MKKNNPKVSFVIRTYNEEKFIGKVLKYVYAQTYKNFEVIIIDSGSIDKTVEIVKKFPVNLIQIKSEEFGHGNTLNVGIKKAKGKYIVIISGHSLPISNNWLKFGMQNFSNSNVAGVTGGSFGTNLGYYFKSLGILGVKIFHKRNNDLKYMSNTNSIIRKDLWRLYPYDEIIPDCEDYDWAIEMISRGYKIVKDPRFAVIHGHTLAGKRSRLWKLAEWRKIVKEINKKKR